MSQHALPKGETRVSSAVVDTVAMTAAREVRGVIDIVGLARGAAIGAAVGVVVGTLSGGVGGAVLGVSAGSAAGAATAHMLGREQKRRSFHTMTDDVPALVLHLSAEYGTDLLQLADDVREQVRGSIRDITGLTVERVEVVFTEVVPPSRFAHRPLPSDES